MSRAAQISRNRRLIPRTLVHRQKSASKWSALRSEMRLAIMRDVLKSGLCLEMDH